MNDINLSPLVEELRKVALDRFHRLWNKDAQQECLNEIRLAMNDGHFTKSGIKAGFDNTPNNALEINPRLAKLQDEIHEWACTNFGTNDTNFSKLTPALCGQTVAMGNLCSLLGIVEELGEASQCFYNIDTDFQEGFQDAMADMTIYLCDFAARSGVALQVTDKQLEHWLVGKIERRIQHETGCLMAPVDVVGAVTLLYVAVGKLVHVNLKAHQGIRGMDNIDTYNTRNKQAILDVLLVLLGTSAFQVIPVTEAVWAKVKQRNWKKNPEKAHLECEHEQAEPSNY